MHRTERKEYSGGEEGFFVTSALFHPRPSMRKLCPNLDQEDGLDTVLEVPVPEETFTSGSKAGGSCKAGCSNTKAWMRHHNDRSESSSLSRCAQLQQLLGVIGAPLVPLPIPAQHSIICCDVRNAPIEASMAKYIVRQYIAAAGGEKVLNSIDSMYAMGKVQMMVSEFRTGGNNNISSNNKKAARGGGEMGGFVLWQKKPDLWCLELVVSGCKISAGSDGRVAWRQTPWHNSHVSRGSPRPLRRSLQGLDPRPTANLFSNSVCIGEKTINGHDCFMLRLDAEASTLRARSSNNVEIIRHTVWGYFSQRTGLLVQLEDTHLTRIKAASEPSVYWETTMQSSIEDYRTIDGISIAHAGRTMLSSFRFGDSNDGQTRTCMEETWSVEEVDFNIQGLSIDCFLPPSDLKQELEGCDVLTKNVCPDIKVEPPAIKVGPSQIAAVDLNDTDSKEQEDGNSSM